MMLYIQQIILWKMQLINWGITLCSRIFIKNGQKYNLLLLSRQATYYAYIFKSKWKSFKIQLAKELSTYNGDFGFPLEVSGSLYRARDLLFILYNTNWENPNTLEGVLYYNLRGLSYMPEMLLYKTSLCFCNPINKVFLQGNNNRTGNKDKYSVENLLKMYEGGYRIPVNKCYGFVPNACHQEVEIF